MANVSKVSASGKYFLNLILLKPYSCPSDPPPQAHNYFVIFLHVTGTHTHMRTHTNTHSFRKAQGPWWQADVSGQALLYSACMSVCAGVYPCVTDGVSSG